MAIDNYDVKYSSNLMTFEFVSEGIKGKITKVVQYTPRGLKNFYNLGFGDKKEETGEVDDMIITDNGDSKKVLATVASTVYRFTEKYPDAMIYATGSTKSRTRMYRIGISNNLKDIRKDFFVFGLKNNQWHDFEADKEYEGFLVVRKKN